MSKDSLVYKWSTTKAYYLSTCAGNLGILFLFVGICAQLFYDDRGYVFIFGMSCSLQVISSLVLHMKCSKENPTWLLFGSLLNLLWIAVAVILFLVFKLWVYDSEFDADMVFQFSLWFYVLIATSLAVVYYFLISHLEVQSSRQQPSGETATTKNRTGPTASAAQSGAVRTK